MSARRERRPGDVRETLGRLAGADDTEVVRTEEAGFRFFLISDHEGFRPGLFPDEVQITAGRRIWPADD